MKRIRAVVAALALSAVLVVPRAEATPVALGWNSSLGVTCVNVSCTDVLFTLNLLGLQATDNNGNAVPAAIFNLNSPGYLGLFTIDIGTGPGLFSAASVLTGSGWTVDFVTSGGLQIFAAHPVAAGVAAPIQISATLTLAGAYVFGYSGAAYLGNHGQCYNLSGVPVDLGSGSCLYRQGDFGGIGSIRPPPPPTVVPEPLSMTLLGTGLLGLGLVGIRRRKNIKK